jgi:hypothetical protein
MNIQPMTMEEYRAAWLEAERELMISGYPLAPVAEVPDTVVVDTGDVGCIGLPDWEPDEDMGSADGT